MQLLKFWDCLIFHISAMHIFGLNWHLQPMQRQMYQLSEDNTSGLSFPTDLSFPPLGNTGLEIPDRKGKEDSKYSFYYNKVFFFWLVLAISKQTWMQLFLSGCLVTWLPHMCIWKKKVFANGFKKWHFRAHASLLLFGHPVSHFVHLSPWYGEICIVILWKLL